MLINNIHLAELKSPNQTIRARVELYKGSTLERVCNCGDILSDLTIERTGEGKFFGFGICQKLSVNLIDINRDIHIDKTYHIEVSFGVNSEYVYPFPKFYIYDDVTRDEASNMISVTAYDGLYVATNHTIEELELPADYSIKTFLAACAKLLNLPFEIDPRADDSFNLYYPGGANFEGTENLRVALNAIAEATQTIYFMDSNWRLYFKRLDKDGEPVLNISKNDYVSLLNTGEQVLTNLIHTTELDDSANTSAVNLANDEQYASNQVTQYMRDNPFYTLREDLDIILGNAFGVVKETTISQIDCYWSGNYLLEIADKISLDTEDGGTIYSYIMDDTITYAGALEHTIKWEYDENGSETSNNPISLGDALNKTFARVDKVNQRITLEANKLQEGIDTNTTSIANLTITTDNISASVKKTEETLQDGINEANGRLNALTEQVNLSITSEDLTIEIDKVKADGVNQITTESKGFKFNDEGLTIQEVIKSVDRAGNEKLIEGEMKTTITEDGMKVYKKNEEVLTANNDGVNAVNLHASTYLIIGGNSRFETFVNSKNEVRTACFWIGE